MIETDIQHKINFKTKPLGSLGVLEKLALQIGVVQKTTTPKLLKPTIIVFAADHGIAKAGVSAYPQEVTHQMVLNFLNGGAAINVFSSQHDITLKVVDAGVNFNFESNDFLIDNKIANGTESFLTGQAITENQLLDCFNRSAKLMEKICETDCNIIGFGEMGIGNTSSAALIMSALCDLPLHKCVGRGTGLTDEQFQNKINILQEAKNFHGDITDPTIVLQTFGGFEIAQICSAMLQAYKNNMLIMVDGFIATSAFLVAFKMLPAIMYNAIFCHVSDEFGHKNMLDYLGAKPILDLNMRLGEGTGCAVAYPIIQSAVAFLNNMASFESAGVSNK